MTRSDFSNKEKAYQIELFRKNFFGNNTERGYWRINDSTIAQDLEFILSPTSSDNNLFEPIRKDVLAYFERYDISWWRQHEDRYFPTGHLLSSQIHCLNHLFALRKDPEAVLAMIQPIGASAGIKFDKVLPSFIDTNEAYYDNAAEKYVSNSNYISFEFVCHNIDMLDETHEKRGAKCTSVDAMIYAQAGKDRWLVPIEWKYAESYDSENEVYSFDRYSKFVNQDSRISLWEGIYKHDPFFELGRQALLMEQLIAHKPLVGKKSKNYPQHPLSADNYLQVIVVPEGNTSMRTDAEIFISSLKDKYRNHVKIVGPQFLLTPVRTFYPSLWEYLQERYWNSNM